MNYRLLYLFYFTLIFSCTEKSANINYDNKFIHYSNKGFALIYDDTLFKKKIVNKKINDRSLTILNINLKNETPVRITNLINGKFLIAKVGKNSRYPLFYNSVISKRIAEDLQINSNEPYVQIQTVNHKNSFIIGKAKTYKEEKKVANKAPVESISIENISNNSYDTKKSNIIKRSKRKFNYIIMIAELYFEDSAKMLKNRLIDEYNVKNIKIEKISKNNYRVYKGPYRNLDSIKNEYNDIMKLNFENIEIIKL